MKYNIYSTKGCPKCELLKKHLTEKGLMFEVKDMTTPESITELRINGIFVLSAPVLQVNEKFYTAKELFDAGGNVVDRF